jgi:pimeloyl-ACP methyl ester carboxylesterase
MKILLFLLAFAAASALFGGCASFTAERKAPPIGRFVDVEGGRIHFVDMGPRDSDLPPVVLIHGASVNLRDMKLALGDELAKTRRVIIVDRPGRGYSTRSKDGAMIATQARMIRDAVKSLGVERPVIVGQSFGGAVALAYALAFQDEVTGLVTIAGVSHEWPGGVAWYNNASGAPVVGFLLRRLVIPVYGPFAAKGGVEESFAPDPAPPGYYGKSGLTLLFRARDFKANADDLRLLKPQIVEQQRRYGEIRIPVAIVTGDADKTVSPQLHSLQLAKEISGATIDVIPDAGHAPHHSETSRVVAAIDAVSRQER